MKHYRIHLGAALGLILTLHQTVGIAAIPAGLVQLDVTDATNHIWDASSIDELQTLTFDISEESTDISFAAPFIQTGAGKLVGAGSTEMQVAAPIFVGTVDSTYKVTGSVTGKGGTSKIAFTGTAKGPAEIGGKTRTVASAFTAKVTVDSPGEFTSGVYVSAASASGYGGIKEVGPIDFAWVDVVAAMGSGAWNLSLQLTNDTVKKVGGSALVTLSSGAELDLAVKGVYKSKTDATTLVLSGSGESKGSALKVNMVDSTIVSIQGKVSGQMIKWKQ